MAALALVSMAAMFSVLRPPSLAADDGDDAGEATPRPAEGALPAANAAVSPPVVPLDEVVAVEADGGDRVRQQSSGGARDGECARWAPGAAHLCASAWAVLCASLLFSARVRISVLPCSSLRVRVGGSLRFPALARPFLCSSLCVPVLPCSSLPFSALPCSSLPFSALPCSSLSFSAHPCTSLVPDSTR